MSISNILKGLMVSLLLIGIYYIASIERNLRQLNNKVSKLNFHTKGELKKIKTTYSREARDSALNSETVIRVEGDVKAFVKNTVDVKVDD